MQKIHFFCRKCGKSLKITYILTGNDESAVLPSLVIKCHHCKRSMYLKNYTEKMLIHRSVDGKFFI